MEPETSQLPDNAVHVGRGEQAAYPVPFPVVGVGASAGGLDAFRKLLASMPADSGMAWILVQHLDPTHDSLLTDLLQNIAPVPVTEISDNTRIQPNHIYVIPSNKILQVKADRLKLSTRPLPVKGKTSLPIDIFFASLAQVYEGHAIGVVLSGTASDGTIGLKMIKDHGGITVAQSADSAAYPGMPVSAIESGITDFILNPEDIPQRLAELVRVMDLYPQPAQAEDDEIFEKVLALLRAKKEMDFTYYKQTTVRRRILRRMVLNKFETPESYLTFLEENAEEQDLLYQDMLIPVTSFFRDKKIFDKLCETVFPSIIKHKSADGHIRIWVAGCSTGQEAYSIAICFKEYLGHKKEKLQIFATDLSEPAILKARSGIYTKAEVESVGPGRLKEYFTFTNGSYRVKKELRDLCVFAVHNFLKDPPFSKIDFVSCRNVLIYMDSYLQKKALSTFHYSLNRNGILMLGKSENTIGVTDLFTAKGKSDKIFVRKDVSAKLLPSNTRKSVEFAREARTRKKGPAPAADFQKLADDIILNNFSPAAVVVNEAMDIVHFRGVTSVYLQQNSGRPTHNLLKLAQPGLGFELRTLLHKVKQEQQSIKKENIVFVNNGGEQQISIRIVPVLDSTEAYYLVMFEPQMAVPKKLAGKKSKHGEDEKSQRIEQLENEIARLREDVRIISDEQEASNEELQTGNEELMSSNEELQSLNEELETSKEELQSTIEELTVVNQEMVNLNEQLTKEKEFAEAIISTVPQPVLVLNQRMEVLLANERFYIKFQLSQREIEGSSLFDLGKGDWNIDSLRDLLENILPDKQSVFGHRVTHHFRSLGEKIMLVNAREIIKNEDEKVILIAIQDITEIAQANQIIKENEFQLQALIAAAPVSIAIFKGKDKIIESPNQAFLDVIGYDSSVTGRPLADVLPEFEALGQPFLDILDQVYSTGEPFHLPAAEVKLVKGSEIAMRHFDLSYTPLLDTAGKVYAVLGIGMDVSEQVSVLKKLEESEKYFRQLTDTVPAIIWITKEDGYCTYLNQPWYDYTGQTKEEGEGFGWLKATHPDDMEMTGETFVKANKARQAFAVVYRIRNKDGLYRWALDSGSPKFSRDGVYEGMVGTVVDIHEEKMAELALKESEEKFQGAVAAVEGIVWTNNAVGEMEGSQPGWAELTGQSYNQYQGYGWSAAVHPDDAQPTIDAWQDALQNQKMFVFEHRLKTKDNEWRRFSVRAIPLKDPDGSIREWVGVHTDVTEKRLAEEKIVESEKRFRQLSDLVPAKVSNSDPEGNVFYYNQSWLDYTGMSMQELKDSGWAQVMHPDEVEFISKRWQQSLASGDDYEVELQLKNRAGEYKWHLSRAVAIKDAQGKILRWVGAATEIHRIKEEEQRKEGFLKMVSHELKTPVTSIKGYVQLLLTMLEETNADSPLPLKTSLGRIDSQVLRLTRLITEMLDLSRIEAGKLELQRKTFNLNALVRETVQDVLHTSQTHHIDIENEIDCDLNGDEDRIGQVLINLLNNAIKYSPVQKRISVKIFLAPKNFVGVRVTDAGIGIDKNDQARVFERFYRVSGQSEMSYSGFGIGLFIANQIIHRHDGYFTVESEKEKGSKFTFFLPIANP